MTPETWQQLKTLFQAAIELEPNQRASFLTEACAADAALRSRVEKLLASHDEAGSFLNSPAAFCAWAAIAKGQGPAPGEPVMIRHHTPAHQPISGNRPA